MKDASEVILATDPDREGESISWHLKEVLKPKVQGPPHRLPRDHRRSRQRGARRSARDVDENLVRAQESRRILDRLYGYTLSPVLWKKVQTGLSAGRVQSVAVRADRRARRRTPGVPHGELLGPRSEAARRRDASSSPRSRKVGGQRVATGKDFDSTGHSSTSNTRPAARRDGRAARCARR